MCGIAGFTGPGDAQLIEKFHGALQHRGPDERGSVCDSSITLIHNRLAIIDLKTGRQPIFNEDRSCAIVFNGEIYNYKELRESLKERHRFTTESDTEVILHLYEEKGTSTPEFLRGDFAFCIWDSRNQSCFLSRDHIGVKPLYYSVTRSGEFVFSSEIRALLQHPGVSGDIDVDAAAEYFTWLYVAAPRTILKRVQKLQPAESLVWKDHSLRTWRYWKIPEVSTSFQNSGDQRERRLQLVKTAIKRRLIADVPVGAFLSGGLDSSVIVALASQDVARLHTFSIGYGEPDFDELQYARHVSERCGTIHHEFVIRPNAETLIDEVIEAIDEPIADSSAIPTFLVSKETHKYVKVALSGIGGDEVFYGYPRYLGAKLGELIPDALKWPVARLSGFWPSRPSGRDLGGWINRFGSGLHLDSYSRYASWTRFMDGPMRSRLLPGVSGDEPEQAVFRAFNEGHGSVLDKIFRVDMSRYVASDLLQFCDNMSMANSLEVRVPYCDVDLVVEMAATPSSARLPGYTLKPWLKEIAKDAHVPRKILKRKKQGFMIPIGRWFRSELKGYLEGQLEGNLLPDMFDRSTVKHLLADHIAGRANHTHVLWAILLLSRWLAKTRASVIYSG